MDLRALAPAAVAFVVIAITVSIGADVLLDIQNDCTNTTASFGETGYCPAYNSYNNGTAALSELASWLPTLGLVLAAAVIIGSVATYFYFSKQ